MKIPAFGWPPRFFNQGAQYFAAIGGDGTIFAKSPGIETITRTGPGVYQVTLNKPTQFPGLFMLAEVNSPGSYSHTQTSETAVTVNTYDASGNPADRDTAFLLYIVPDAWKIIP